jgi:hypothetical protein
MAETVASGRSHDRSAEVTGTRRVPPGGRGPHEKLQTGFDNRLESHPNPAIHPKGSVHDQLAFGKKLRILTIVDTH